MFEIRRKASCTSCLRGKLAQHLSAFCPTQDSATRLNSRTADRRMASKEPGQGDVFPRGGSLSPGNLSRITFVFFENENGSRKCHWVIAWREWLTKKTNHSHRLADNSTVTQQLWPGHVAFQGKAGVALRETCLDGRPELACPSISPPCSSASWYQSAA